MVGVVGDPADDAGTDRSAAGADILAGRVELIELLHHADDRVDGTITELAAKCGMFGPNPPTRSSPGL